MRDEVSFIMRGNIFRGIESLSINNVAYAKGGDDSAFGDKA